MKVCPVLWTNKIILSTMERDSFPIFRTIISQVVMQLGPQQGKKYHIQKVARTVKALQKLTKCAQCVVDREPCGGKEGSYNDFPTIHVNHQRDSAITREGLGVWGPEL